MKSYFTEETIQKTLKLAGLYNVLWGLAAIFLPHVFSQFLSMEMPQAAILWQCIGFAVGVYGIGFYIASFEPENHWPIVLVGLVTKILITLVFLKNILSGALPLKALSMIVLDDVIWIIPFYYALIFAYDTNTADESAPKKFNDLIRFVKTNQGDSLYDLSERSNVLLVFVRHFGCTFCRETISEIAKLDASIKGKNLTPVFVHMSDPTFADEFFSRYYTHPVAHVSDPGRVLYKSLNLKRGSFNQIFGPRTWIRGFWAGLFKGHGLGNIEGDVLQLGGYFILSRGQIVFEYKNKAASEFFKLEVLPHA